MNKIHNLNKYLDGLAEVIGRGSAYFAALMVLITCYVVITRYIFNTGSIAIQESVLYINAIVVFGTVSYTLKQNGHVRVDVIYGPTAGIMSCPLGQFVKAHQKPTVCQVFFC